jgi:hypothetical protein
MSGNSNGSDWFMSQTQLEIAADLTDNVSTVVNLINERDWSGGSTALSGTDNYQVSLDLAYVQMKEIFYSPLTLKIGRQDIWWGRGFVIGNNRTMWNQQASMSAPEYSVQTAFDAIRATLDFNPWTIDAIFAKINGGGAANVNMNDDQDVYGVNVGYKFAEYNAIAEGYFVSDWNRNGVDAPTSNALKTNHTEMFGGRVQFDPISQITLGGEMAYQFGNVATAPPAGTGATAYQRDLGAWAADVFGTYRWDLTWKPDLTLEYVYFSGEEDQSTTSTNSFGAWNPLFRGRFYTAYEDFRQNTYATAQVGDSSGMQNSEMLQVKANIKPMDDLLLTGSYSYFWSPEKEYSTIGNPNTQLDNQIGQEIDFQVTYDYTEDVTFGLLTAWFFPGDKFVAPNDKTAMDLVASTKVTF